MMMNRRRFFQITGAAVALAAVSHATLASAAKVNAPNGLAISGYDPVAYFTQNTAVPGRKDISADHGGATYRFSTSENRDAFVANPDRYTPEYGGYCAFAVANGYTAKIDPEAFSVVDNKLYLNFNKRIRSRWSRDVPGNIAKGDTNWPNLSQ